MENVFQNRGYEVRFDAGINSDTVEITREDRVVTYQVNRISDTEWILSNGSEQFRVFAAADREGKRFIHSRGQTWCLDPVEDDFDGAGDAGGSSDGRLMAAMPGKVIKILVELNQEVSREDPVLILESMKMESTQEAPFDGRVVEINASEGQQVDAGTVIVLLEPLEDPEE